MRDLMVIPQRKGSTMVERIWLQVPYADKDTAKAAGARWDPQARSWYAPRPGMKDLEEWAPLPPVPKLLPGEDRGFGAGLFVDLVPSSCWFTNVRTCVDARDWDRLRTMVYHRAGQRCEACGAADDRANRYLEAHERWHYDDTRTIQVLRRLVCLCTPCHEATHYGLATIRGRDRQASAHLRTVTGLSAVALDRHLADAYAAWQERSRRTWSLDLSILTAAGIRLATPPRATDREAIAQGEITRARPR
jgi:hypothetical protein